MYLSPLTHFLSPLSIIHYKSLYIYHQRLSLPASYSFYHFLLFNSSFSHYLTLYLSHTISLTLSVFYRAPASPISIMPRNKLGRDADLLPLSPLLLLHKLGGVRGGFIINV